MDNSDSPSIVEQLQQGHDSSCYILLTVIPSSVKYLIPYACQLTSCNTGISCCVLLSLISLFTYVPQVLLLHNLHQLGLCNPFYLRCFLIEPWDSMSGCVHPGIVCLASWASDWAGAFWASFLVCGWLPFVRCPSKCDPC